jgi:hypothetical protein
MGQKGVSDRVRGNLVSRIYGKRFFPCQLIVSDGNAVADQLSLTTKKPRIDIKGRLQTVAIQNSDQSPILRDTVVEAERECLLFSIPHKKSPPSFFHYIPARQKSQGNKRKLTLVDSFPNAPIGKVYNFSYENSGKVLRLYQKDVNIILSYG